MNKDKCNKGLSCGQGCISKTNQCKITGQPKVNIGLDDLSQFIISMPKAKKSAVADFDKTGDGIDTFLSRPERLKMLNKKDNEKAPRRTLGRNSDNWRNNAN